MLHSKDFNFSFSGLKTAVLTVVKNHEEKVIANICEQDKANIARGFVDAIVDVLTAKCVSALRHTGLKRLVIAGGVGANAQLRDGISLVPSNDDDLELAVTVEVAEISGSETFLHVRNEHFLLVLHLPGVHEYDVDAPIRIYIPTHKLFVFDTQGRLVQAPGRRIARVA